MLEAALVVLRAIAARSDDVPLPAGARLSDMKSVRAACSLLVPASRHGRSHLPMRLPRCAPSPLGRPSRSPQRRSRARTGRHSSSTSNDVLAPLLSCRRMCGVPAFSLSCSPSTSSGLPARGRRPVHPRPSATFPRALGRAVIVGEQGGARAGRASTSTNDVPASSQRRSSPPSRPLPARARTPVLPRFSGVLCSKASSPEPLLVLPCAAPSSAHVGECRACSTVSPLPVLERCSQIPAPATVTTRNPCSWSNDSCGREQSTAARPAAAASRGSIDGGGHTGLECPLPT